MLLAYGAIMATVIYFLNDCKFDKWKAITWSMFFVFGMLQCYRWSKSKIVELNDKKD